MTSRKRTAFINIRVPLIGEKIPLHHLRGRREKDTITAGTIQAIVETKIILLLSFQHCMPNGCELSGPANQHTFSPSTEAGPAPASC